MCPVAHALHRPIPPTLVQMYTKQYHDYVCLATTTHRKYEYKWHASAEPVPRANDAALHATLRRNRNVGINVSNEEDQDGILRQLNDYKEPQT